MPPRPPLTGTRLDGDEIDDYWSILLLLFLGAVSSKVRGRHCCNGIGACGGVLPFWNLKKESLRLSSRAKWK